MKFIKSPILWFALFGMAVGYFGVPVVAPGYVMWVWHRPQFFYIASILILGALGCLVGVFFHYWIWRRLDRKAALWTIGISGLALVIGAIGVFRYQAYNETVMWTDVNLGFARVMGMSMDHFPNTDAGMQLIQAGADIEAGVNIGGVQYFGQSQFQQLSSIASVFSEAGYYIISQKNTEKQRESIQFVKQSGSMIRKIGNQSYPNKTKHFEAIISEINHIIPNDFDRTWQAN